MPKVSEKTQKAPNANGIEKKKNKKHTLKKIYTADEDDKALVAQPAKIGAKDSVREEAVEILPGEARSIFLEDKLPYEPGAGFVLSQESPSLPCNGLDSSTHELWLLQLPLDWQFKAPAKITVKRRKGDSVLGECTSDRGDGYSLVQEHASLAAPLYVASATLKDGVPAQIHRRVTLVRSGVLAGEEEEGLPSAQQPAVGPSSNGSGNTPKRKKAKAAQQDVQQPGTKELRMEDIVVKQESPDGKKQKEKKKKKKKKDNDVSAGAGNVASQ